MLCYWTPLALANLPTSVFSSHSFFPSNLHSYPTTAEQLCHTIAEGDLQGNKIIKLNIILDSKFLFGWGAANHNFSFVEMVVITSMEYCNVIDKFPFSLFILPLFIEVLMC